MAQSNVTPEFEIASNILSKNNISTILETDEICRYNGGVFHRGKKSLSEIRESITTEALNLLIPVGKTVKPYRCSTSKRHEIVELIKTHTFTSISEFDKEDDCINLLNGTVKFQKPKMPGMNTIWADLSTHGIYAINDDAYFITHPEYNESPYKSLIQIPHTFNPDAECLEIDQFLTDIFGFNRVPDIYEMLAYLIMPTVKYQKAFILYGPPKTGKTSFINLVNQFIGGNHKEKVISEVPLQDLDERFQISNLRDKLVNIFDDLRSTKLTSQGRFRMSVTNPTITAEIKHITEHVTWKNICKHLFTCNQLPKVNKKVGDEFWRRWKLFDCYNIMEGEKHDIDFVNKRWSEAELSGLLNKCIQAWIRLEKRKHFQDDDIEYIKGIWQMDIEPAKLFVEEKCELSTGAEINVDLFWNTLNQWRKDYNATPITKTMLTQSLQRISDKISKPKRRKGNIYVYEGIQFIEGVIKQEIDVETLQDIVVDNLDQYLEEAVESTRQESKREESG